MVLMVLNRCFKEEGRAPLSSGIVNLRNKKTGYNTDDEQAAQTEYRSSSHYTRAPPGELGVKFFLKLKIFLSITFASESEVHIEF